MLPFLLVYQILRILGAHMYLTAKKTVSGSTTCSSTTEGDSIKSNDSHIRISYCSKFESNIQ